MSAWKKVGLVLAGFIGGIVTTKAFSKLYSNRSEGSGNALDKTFYRRVVDQFRPSTDNIGISVDASEKESDEINKINEAYYEYQTTVSSSQGSKKSEPRSVYPSIESMHRTVVKPMIADTEISSDSFELLKSSGEFEVLRMRPFFYPEIDLLYNVCDGQFYWEESYEALTPEEGVGLLGPEIWGRIADFTGEGELSFGSDMIFDLEDRSILYINNKVKSIAIQVELTDEAPGTLEIDDPID